MAVVPLNLGRSVATTEVAFQERGGRRGSTLLIRHFDDEQLRETMPNTSYDLRIGGVYKDHRDGWRRELLPNEEIVILPGGAVLIETEESVHMPAGLFGYIVPRVLWLQRGVSNTLSKIDPGYNGHLVVTLFNLGKKTAKLPRGERFCCLVIHDVSEGVLLYEGDPKTITGDAGPRTVAERLRKWCALKWQHTRNRLEAHPATIHLGLIVVTFALFVIEFLQLFGIVGSRH